MGMNYFTNPVVFVLDSVFSFYIIAVFLRFLLQWCRADFRNPISKFLIAITHPPLKILRRFIPAIGNIDTASLVLLFVLQLLSDVTIGYLQGVISLNAFSIGGLVLTVFAQLIALLLHVLFYAVFARALLSWFDQGGYNDISRLLYSITEPMLRIFRAMLPNLGGLDLSVILALMGLQLAEMLLLPPLYQLANLIG